MALKWTDTLDIAIELDEAHPGVDPLHVNFVDLRNWVLALEDFDDDPEHSGERILEMVEPVEVSRLIKCLAFDFPRPAALLTVVPDPCPRPPWRCAFKNRP
jgi:FeS assembly protein IscX